MRVRPVLLSVVAVLLRASFIILGMLQCLGLSETIMSIALLVVIAVLFLGLVCRTRLVVMALEHLLFVTARASLVLASVRLVVVVLRLSMLGITIACLGFVVRH